MKKNLYYRAVYQRRNVIKETFLSFFMDGALTFRLILEVFIRKNMGIRYFRLSAAIWTAFFLMIVPFIPNIFGNILPSSSYYGYGSPGVWETIKEHWIWYSFITVFLYFSYLRHREVKRIHHLFDFEHFSKSAGEFHPFYLELRFKGKPFTPRQLETFIEPLPFFLIGVLFMIIGQKLFGGLIAFSAFSYAMSYRYAYMIGDNFIMDMIDEIICNKALSNTFVDRDETSFNGFRMYAAKPKSRSLREKLLKNMIIEDDDFADAF